MKTVTKIEANQRTTGSEKKLRVAAYCRVSTDSDDQLESLLNRKSTMKPTFRRTKTGISQAYTMMRE